MDRTPITPAKLAYEICELIAKVTASPENPGTFAQPFLWRTAPLSIDEVADLQKRIEERLSDACFQCTDIQAKEAPRSDL